MRITYPNIMGTGEGSQGSYPLSYPVRTLVVNRDSPLDGGSQIIYNTESLTVDHRG